MSPREPSVHKQPKYKALRRKNDSFAANMRRLSVIINQNTSRKIKNIMEDNTKTIINVAGDYVQSKHVDYEINNVEAGGIGIQFVNGKQTTIKPSASSTRKHDTSVPYTIRYMNANDQSRIQRLQLLMRCLQKLQWIEEPKSADDFRRIGHFVG